MTKKSLSDINSIEEGFSEIQEEIIKLTKEKYSINKEFIEFREKNKKKKKEELLGLLEVLDAFDRVFENIQQKQDKVELQMRIWIGNFKSVRRLYWNNLKLMGVKVIENPSGVVMPGTHIIEKTVKVEGMKDETILEVLEKGYLWNNEVLRKEKVIIVKN